MTSRATVECIVWWVGKGPSPLHEMRHDEWGKYTLARYDVVPMVGDHVECPSYVGGDIPCEVVSVRMMNGGGAKLWVKELKLVHRSKSKRQR